MEYKDTHTKINFFDKIESNHISFDEVSIEDKNLIQITFNEDSFCYLSLDQTRDLAEKLIRFVQKN